MRTLRLIALVCGVALLALSAFNGIRGAQARVEDDLDNALTSEVAGLAGDIANYFERARAIDLLMANMPAFSSFYAEPGERADKVRRGSPDLDRVNAVLVYLQSLYPGRIGETCFIDVGGAENARVVRGIVADHSELSQDEAENPFFAPTFALAPGDVYQARPYVSPDTHEWVISNSTPIPMADGSKSAIVHFEVTLDSFRREAGHSRFPIRIVEARTGAVIADSRFRQRLGAPLGRPADRSLRFLVDAPKRGIVTRNGQQLAFQRVEAGAHNANAWYVVAAAAPVGLSLAGALGPGTIAMMLAALLMLALAAWTFRAYQARLLHAALTDDLTGLPNRVLFNDRVEQGIASGRREDLLAAVMILDLDRFKDVNDTLGHHHGDLLLQEVARRLAGCVRESDTLSRLGGDEFALLLPRLPSGDFPLAVAERIRKALEEPMTLDGVPVQIDPSVGISLYPTHGADVATLLQRADIAMYEAKRTGAGIAVYSGAENDLTPQRLAMVPELRRAIERRELVLDFQPKIDLASRQIRGVEALVRWQHPALGRVMPDDFIGLAEDTGLIKPLALVVIDVALAQCRRWRDAGFEIPVSVNLSARNLLDPQLLSEIEATLRRWELPPTMLLVELTETAMMADCVRALEVLGELGSMGIGLSVDDFGTGYSSLAYLKELPLDEIKIDRGFVSAMASDEADASIVRATIDLGRDLGLKVVAEGVEDERTLAELQTLGCDLAQGFFVSRPLPGDELVDWLRSHCAPETINAPPDSRIAAKPHSVRPRWYWTPPRPAAQ